MPKVTFVYADGRQETVSANAGDTILQLAMGKSVDGIIGECGGSLMCASCHVFVDPEFYDIVGEASTSEDEMLDVTAAERRATSRLGCQVVLTEEMDGLILHLPETQ